MSRIFQALARTTNEAAELARKLAPVAASVVAEAAPATANDRAAGEEPEAPKPPLRLPRVVEWKPPSERPAPVELGATAPRRDGPVPMMRQPEMHGRLAPVVAIPADRGVETEQHPAADEREPEAHIEHEAAAPALETAPVAEPAEPEPPAAPRETGHLVKMPSTATQHHDVRRLPVTASSSRPILPFDLGDTAVNEGYRKIRTQLLKAPSEPRVIVVASPAQGDGKTLTSINLAGALALKHDVSVALVDADLRRGAVASSCGLPQGPGLGDYLSGRALMEDSIIRVDQLPNLFIMTAGDYRTNPVELLDSSRWKTLVTALRKRFRFVIIDVPPMGSLADYDLVEALSDGVLLVVRQDHTTRTAVHNALRSIPEGKRLGVILNAATSSFFTRRSGYGMYGNSYTMAVE